MKVVFVSNLLPDTHYSQYLTKALVGQEHLKLVVYADKNLDNLRLKGCGQVKNVWSPGIFFPFQIAREIAYDRPDIIHLQYENNMYGRAASIFLFPLLLFLLKLMRYPTIVTLHVVIDRQLLTEDFALLFGKVRYNSSLLKIMLAFSAKLNGSLSSTVIVHTEGMKGILCSQNGVDREKVKVIPHGIPDRVVEPFKKSNCFVCFGYVVRRKGLEEVIRGFTDFSQHHSDYSLVIAGGAISGQEDAYRQIRKLVQSNSLGTVRFLGFIPEARLGELYSTARAVIIPAKVSISASGPLAQALSFGKCVIGSDVGFLKEEIAALGAGFLVKDSAWAQAFEFIVDNPSMVSLAESNVMRNSPSRSFKNIASLHSRLYRGVLHSMKRWTTGL